MRFDTIVILVGVLLLVAPAVLPTPEAMPDTAWYAAGLASAMALWWITESLPLAATALLPVAVSPIMGLMDLSDVARSYSDPLIFLFLGGFLIAKAIEKSGLHRRLAGALLGRAGSSSRGILGVFMLCTAFLSLWISNTASAMVVAPIAAAVAKSQADTPHFATTLMLGVAFSATIGGMGSLIGTPPNAIFAAYVRTSYGVDVGFAQWAAVGIPVSSVLLLVTWFALTRVSPRLPSSSLKLTYGTPQSAIQDAELRVAIIAGLTALAWVSRPLIERVFPTIELSDAGIAMIAALTLFICSDGKGGRLLDWKAAASLRWDVLILFGGGLALAGVIQQSGLATWIGGSARLVGDWPQILVLLFIAALIVFVGELASNTAMAAIFLPIAGAIATGVGSDPVAFLLPIAMAASIGFMLPVATPPNAIVFADPAVTRSDMLRAGAPLDVVSLLVTVGLASVLGSLVLG
jgi:solute carrier family 13 (sodium-dependent dicarboxylate transporter), member 2/3/5